LAPTGRGHVLVGADYDPVRDVCRTERRWESGRERYRVPLRTETLVRLSRVTRSGLPGMGGLKWRWRPCHHWRRAWPCPRAWHEALRRGQWRSPP